MIILGINTATGRTAVALIEMPEKGTLTAKKSLPGRGFKILFSRIWDSNRDEAEKLIPAITAALKKSRTDMILVVKGPGAFTGLRIGVTAANTLAFVLNAPILGLSTYDFLRARIPGKYTKKSALLLKAGGQFAAVLLPGRKKPQRLANEKLTTFFKKHPEIKFVIGDMGASERKKYPLPKNIRWLPENLLGKFPVIIAKFAGKKTSRKLMIKPLYMLPPKITKSKKPVFINPTFKATNE